MFLFPKINYQKVLRKYQKQARIRRARPSSEQVARRVQGLASIMDLPAMLTENLYFDGEWMRRELRDQRVQFVELVALRREIRTEHEQERAELFRLDQGLHAFEEIVEQPAFLRALGGTLRNHAVQPHVEEKVWRRGLDPFFH